MATNHASRQSNQSQWRNQRHHDRCLHALFIRVYPCPSVVALMTQKQFILSLEGVNKSFDGFKAINDLNFYMDEGELRLIIGPNGAGKSTMLDIITGRTRPDKGKVEFGNETDLTRLNEYQINRLGIGRKFQTPSVYVDHTVFENIWLSLEGPRSVWSTLFSRRTAAQRERIHEVL